MRDPVKKATYIANSTVQRTRFTKDFTLLPHPYPTRLYSGNVPMRMSAPPTELNIIFAAITEAVYFGGRP
jgi:hypothetical protein